MNIDDLRKGMQLKVITWDDRPIHWTSSGEMDHWQGKVVTILDIYKADAIVYFEEDDHGWMWQPEDFEQLHPLKDDNPNITFSKLGEAKFLEFLKGDLVNK